MKTKNRDKNITSEKLTRNKEIDKVLKLNLITFLGIGSIIVAQIVIALLLLANLGKATPILVQTKEETFLVEEKPPWYRSESTISNFTENIFTSMFTWDGYLMPINSAQQRNPVKDPGIKIEVENRGVVMIPTSTYEASLAIEPILREEFLANLSSKIPPRVFTGELQIVFVPREILRPEAKQEGYWEQSFVSNLMVFSQQGTKLETIIPFNKTVQLKSVPKPNYREFETKEAELISKYRKNGLEIIGIEDYEPNN